MSRRICALAAADFPGFRRFLKMLKPWRREKELSARAAAMWAASTGSKMGMRDWVNMVVMEAR